jgi:uncharacterized protein (TIGR02599 family)
MKTNSLFYSFPKRHGAFTLIELLSSIAVLALMMTMVFQMLDQTQKTYSNAKGIISSYKEARDGIEAINRNMSQAVMNTYTGYRSVRGVPSSFEEKSDLHFISGQVSELLGNIGSESRVTHAVFFQAPLGFQTIQGKLSEGSSIVDLYSGMDALLNSWGYFVEYGSDKDYRPQFLNQYSPEVEEKLRFRLIEFRQPAEVTTVYQYKLEDRPLGTAKNVLREWFNKGTFSANDSSNYDPLANSGKVRTTRPVADNVVAMIVSPRLPDSSVIKTGSASLAFNAAEGFQKATDIAPAYFYDTRAFQSLATSATASAIGNPVTFSRHRLPPLVRVTLVAVDEIDFNRFNANREDQSSLPFLENGNGLFENVNSYAKDLEALTETLTQLKVRNRIFTTDVRIRASNMNK